MTCVECGMTKAEWEREEAISPSGHPCCDEPLPPMTPAEERRYLVQRLQILPHAIARAEEAVLAAESQERRAARSLQRCEDGLLLDGAIDGKNAETRAAQLRALTAGAGANVEHVAETVCQAKITLRLLQNQHSSLRAIARLLGGE